MYICMYISLSLYTPNVILTVILTTIIVLVVVMILCLNSTNNREMRISVEATRDLVLRREQGNSIVITITMTITITITMSITITSL